MSGIADAGSAPRLPDGTRLLAMQLLDRREHLAQQVRDAVVAHEPRYADADQDQLLVSAREHVETTLHTLAGITTLGTDPLEASRATAAHRADSGFPLESLLHAFRVGTEIIWAALLDQAQESPETQTELLQGAIHVMQLLDAMSVAAAGEYRAREGEVVRRDIQRRQTILDALLDGRGADPDVADEARRVLAISDNEPLAVVVLRNEAGTISPRTGLAAHGFTSDWRLRDDQEVGLVSLGQAPVERLAERLRSVVTSPDGAVAISMAVTNLGEVASAYRMAELTLATLESGVATFDDRLLETLTVANPVISQRIREQAFGALLDLPDDRRQLFVDTLEAWFRHGSTAAVSAELHCHRNTVLNRLSRIEEMSGRHLDDSRDTMLLQLALLAERHIRVAPALMASRMRE